MHSGFSSSVGYKWHRRVDVASGTSSTVTQLVYWINSYFAGVALTVATNLTSRVNSITAIHSLCLPFTDELPHIMKQGL